MLGWASVCVVLTTVLGTGENTEHGRRREGRGKERMGGGEKKGVGER